MSIFTADLANILTTVRCDGDFYMSGTADIALPRLEIEGVGRISLPLLPVQAEQIMSVATRAPFGRGGDTIIDTAVRKTWQIQPQQVQLASPGWPAALDAIVARAAAGLGVTEAVSAELYKLLVYDEGSFFLEHRDTEKCPGMFATLVLVLPSEYSGGELIVQHRGREVCLDLNRAAPTEISFAAFYADCVHEVRPLTSGCRLTLVYNLIRKAGKAAPALPDYEAESAALTTLLQQWAQRKEAADDDAPEKLIYPLEHAYTSAELSFHSLKGADAAAARLLVSAAAATKCELHLALMTIEETGSAEHDYRSSRRHRSYSCDDDDDDDDGYEDENDSEDFEIGEIIESHLTLSDWRSPNGDPAPFRRMPFIEEELSPPDAFADIAPDEQYFHEATGNEGASFERTYRRAALVLWPRERKLRMLSQAGLAVTLPYLAHLAELWARSGEDKESILWRDAQTLSGLMLAGWPAPERYPAVRQADDASSYLSSLGQLGDLARVDSFLATAPAMGNYHGDENAALTDALKRLTADRAAELLAQIMRANAQDKPGSCAQLLARISADVELHVTPALLHPAAQVLVETLLHEPVTPPLTEPWRRPAFIAPDLIDDLLTVLHRIGAAQMADDLVTAVLARPARFGMDTILIPAVLSLTEREEPTKDDPAVQSLRAACLQHLRARIAEPLAPPADFARPCALACRCAYCTELGRFLADPARPRWAFKAAETHRRHVQASIRNSGCDLDLSTQKQGSPHSLIAAKNQASYERRVVQRGDDFAILGRLDQ